MRRLPILPLLLIAMSIAVWPAAGQGRVVTSSAPDDVALTVYRTPYGGGRLLLDWLQGFALVTETRRVRLPRGPATLRFEGVAEGIVPVSAVIDGLPGGVVEKNRDARLLSPASLVDGSLGNRVTLTRTDRATGRVVREDATIVAGPRPGVVLRTARGIETLRCSGLSERIDYPAVPPGLSAKPVLSVATVSPVARTVTVRLSYLASGFDWRASYVAAMAADGRTLDLSAWLTLANGNGQRFANAEVGAVAGRLNRVATRAMPRGAAALRLQCYPLGTTTSGLRENRASEEIVVTGARASLQRGRGVSRERFGIVAPAPPAPAPLPPEDLGDLKLYRIPERVAVAPRAQKQVALLARAGVPFDRRHRRWIAAGETVESSPMPVVLVLRNRRDAGLGLALPAGTTALYATTTGGTRLLLGEGELTDRAEGETFRIAAGISAGVRIEQRRENMEQAVLTVRNTTRAPVTLEVPIGAAGQKIDARGEALPRIDGIATWSPTIAPGASAELRYGY